MFKLNDAALAWLRDHHGIITAEQLTLCGVPRRVVERLVACGVLVSVHRGVYRIASQPVTIESRVAALSAFQPEGYLTGGSAGRLYGLRRMPYDTTTEDPGSTKRPVELLRYTVPHGGWLDLSGIELHQSRKIERTDVQVRVDGMRLASPWRLAFDLASVLPAVDLDSVIEQILAQSMCREITLAATAKRLAHPRRPGSKEFVAALQRRLPGGPLESHPEVRVARALQAAGVPIVAQSTWLELPNGRRARLDLSVPDVRWGLEVDAHPDHFLAQGTADRRRDRQCHQIGWQVDRVTGLELNDFDALIADLVETYKARVAEITGRRPADLG